MIARKGSEKGKPEGKEDNPLSKLPKPGVECFKEKGVVSNRTEASKNPRTTHILIVNHTWTATLILIKKKKMYHLPILAKDILFLCRKGVKTDYR